VVIRGEKVLFFNTGPVPALLNNSQVGGGSRIRGDRTGPLNSGFVGHFAHCQVGEIWPPLPRKS
jgi:hypothetical protein